jgi:vacuolar-type H+-ATPase subunit I/STV1
MDIKQLHVYLKNAVTLVEGVMAAESRAAEAETKARQAEKQAATLTARASELEAVAARKITEANAKAEEIVAHTKKQAEREMQACRAQCETMVAEVKDDAGRTAKKLKEDRLKLTDLHAKIESAQAQLAKLEEFIESNKKKVAALVA